MLEEELVDLFTECLRRPDAADTPSKKDRIAEIGSEIHADGGLDAMVNFFFAVRNRVAGETGLDPATMQSIWNGIDPGWTEAARQLPAAASDGEGPNA